MSTRRSSESAPEVRPAESEPQDEYDESMSEEEEEEEDYSTEDESEEEDVLFDFVLTKTGDRKILQKGDLTSSFGIDVAVHAAKLGAEIRKKTDSLRIVGKLFTLKLTSQDEDDTAIDDAFEEISNPGDVSAEAKLLAFFIVGSD